MKKLYSLIIVLICVLFCACEPIQPTVKPAETSANSAASTSAETTSSSQSTEGLPKYSGKAYAEINNNYPEFTDRQKKKTKSFEKYSRLDKLGRCGVAFANISTDLMPTEKRTSISSVKPTGWKQATYAFLKEGHLYDRCHLIAHQLTGENANERNLITGTRYMNVKGMLPFEEKVGDYIRATNNHVLYRVTPIFTGENLVADGVKMEAWSVEDNGTGVCFNVFCFNVQPGVLISYASGASKENTKITGKSHITASKSTTSNSSASNSSASNSSASKSSAGRSNSGSSGKSSASQEHYVLNISRMKFHRANCSSVNQMSEKNREDFHGDRNDLIKQGYSPCGSCNP